MGDPYESETRADAAGKEPANTEVADNEATNTETAGDQVGSDGRVVAICGVPGVGKTTAAEWITETLDGELLRSDVIRKELFPNPSYTEAERQQTYEKLFDRACTLVSRGETVILDATFAQRRYRDRLRSRAADAGITLEFVEVDCAEPIVRERIAAREGASDADFEVYLYYRYRFDPIRGEHLTVDNSNGLAETYAQLEQYFSGVSSATSDVADGTDVVGETDAGGETDVDGKTDVASGDVSGREDHPIGVEQPGETE